MNEITARQKQVLEFIKEFINSHKYPPSVREIASHFQLGSAAGVHKHIKALEKKRYLRKENNLSRSIQLIEPSGSKGQNKTKSKNFEISVEGLVAAGKPIQAINSNHEKLSVSEDMVGSLAGKFALKVQGESMIEDGILDGDYVILDSRKQARNGETVVALINGEDATLKKIYIEGNSIRLQPANPSMQPIILSGGEFSVQGVVVGLWRPFTAR